MEKLRRNVFALIPLMFFLIMLETAFADAPAILNQPDSLTIAPGFNAVFKARVTGSRPLFFTWKKNGVAIPNINSEQLQILNVKSSDAGTYSFTVRNRFGTRVSRNAILTVLTPPVITSGPVSLTVKNGTNATLSVAVSGSPTLSYQWMKNGVNINGYASSYTIVKAGAANQGSYSVLVSNGAGKVVSSSAQLTIGYPPEVSAANAPLSQNVVQGTKATFKVSPAGTQPFTFQWKKDGVAIAGAVKDSLVVENVQPANKGKYSVVVNNAFGTVESSGAVLDLIYPPSITVQPKSQVLKMNDALTLSASVASNAPLSWQWKKNGQDIPNGTSPTFTIQKVAPSDAGDYSFFVKNAVGSASSLTAKVTVLIPPVIKGQPLSADGLLYNSATFSVVAEGENLQYQWKKDGINISGATSSTYSIPSLSLGHAGLYTVVVTNAGGAVTSSAARLNVLHNPSYRGSKFAFSSKKVAICPGTATWCQSNWPAASYGTVYQYVINETRHNGKIWPRSAYVYVPKRVISASPVLMFLHGGTSSSLSVFEKTKLIQMSDSRGLAGLTWSRNTKQCKFNSSLSMPRFTTALGAQCTPEVATFKTNKGMILVMPDGVLDQGSTTDRHWEDGRTLSPGFTVNDEQRDDVGFIDNLLAAIKTQEGSLVNPNQVYISGHSNGGMMTVRLACNAHNPNYKELNRVAAFSVAIASMPANLVTGAFAREKCPTTSTHQMGIAFFSGDGILTDNCSGAYPCAAGSARVNGDGVMPFGARGGVYYVNSPDRGQVIATQDAYDYFHRLLASVTGNGGAVTTSQLGFYTAIYEIGFAGKSSHATIYYTNGGLHTTESARNDFYPFARLWEFLSAHQRNEAGELVVTPGLGGLSGIY